MNQAELIYLQQASYLPFALQNYVRSWLPTSEEIVQIQVEAEIAEEFRSAFTDRLAEAGFDASYDPNCEGVLLEGLIDRFAV